MTTHKPVPRNVLDAMCSFLEIADFTTDSPQLDSAHSKIAKPTITAVNAPRREMRDINQFSSAAAGLPPSDPATHNRGDRSGVLPSRS